MVPVLVGCRDRKPVDPFDRDLGTDGVVLLPTTPVFTDPGVARGQAEWHPFRKPGAARPKPPAAVPAPRAPDSLDHEDSRTAPAVTQKADDATPHPQTTAAIRALVDEYNGVVADGSVQELLDYFIEEQLEALEPVLEKVTTLAELFSEMRQILDAKMPRATERVAAVFTTLAPTLQLRLDIQSVKATSDTEATVTTAPSALGTTFRLVLVDEEWFLALPDAAGLGRRKPALANTLTTYQGWLQDLRSGNTSPAEILQKLETAAQAGKKTNPAP